jgi:uncharacterized protein (DUF1501 family)
MPVSRRNILKSAALGGMLAGLPPGVRLSFAAGSAPHVIVFVLLRGAMDGLNLVAPSDDADLIAARPAGLRLLSTGASAALPLANGPSANDWRLHPSAPELKALYDSGHLAFIHASGIPADSRSHFEMQSMLEHGVADTVSAGQTTGWIGRYATQSGIAASTFALISAAATLPPSMSGDANAISLPNPSQFTLGSSSRSAFLSAAYNSATGLVGGQGRFAIAAVNGLQQQLASFTAPPAGTYSNDSFGAGLSVVAELIKLGVGLQVAEVEYSNWDTHVNQQPRFAASATILSKGLGSFYNDLSAYSQNVTTVVMSEFGRRVQSNANLGTDHGHGNVMMVLGGSVAGGRIYGGWLGLNPSVLNIGDVPITTDYRSVLSEVIKATRGDLPATLFPGFTPGPRLGLFGASAS